MSCLFCVQGAVRSTSDASQSDSSFFSPDRSLSNLFRPSGTPQSPLKMPQNVTSLTPQSKPQQSPVMSMLGQLSKVKTPESPGKSPVTGSSLLPKPQQPAGQLTKLQLLSGSASEQIKKTPPIQDDSQALRNETEGHSKLSANSSAGTSELKQKPNSGVSAISVVSSMIEGGISKDRTQKMERPDRSESVTDEPAVPVVSPVTPDFHEKTAFLEVSPRKLNTSQGPSQDAPKPPSGISQDILKSSLLEKNQGISMLSKPTPRISNPSSSEPSQTVSKVSSYVQNKGMLKSSFSGPSSEVPKTSSQGLNLSLINPSSQSPIKSRPSLHLSHPKKRPYVVEEVIEILSSDDETGSMDIKPTDKTSIQNEQEKQLQRSKDNATTAKSSTVLWQDDQRNLESDISVSKNTDSANKIDESRSKIDPNKEPGKADLSDSKDLPILDPSTGLFVTDSDSQSSVYVANPENISFEDELMVEDDD